MSRHIPRLVPYMSMSLDGFIAGPGTLRTIRLGQRAKHCTVADLRGEDPTSCRTSDEPGQTVFDEMMSTGAVITGRRTGDLVDYWGGDHHDGVPIFVPTHHAPQRPHRARTRPPGEGAVT